MGCGVVKGPTEKYCKKQLLTCEEYVEGDETVMLIERSIRVSGTCERFERLLIHIVHHIVVPSTTGILIVDEKL